MKRTTKNDSFLVGHLYGLLFALVKLRVDFAMAFYLFANKMTTISPNKFRK